MTTRIARAVMLMLTLGGCASNADVQIRQELAAIDDDKCRSFGSRPEVPAYVACRSRIIAARTGRSCFGSCH
ncbi:MAG: hypothetical protein J2P54_01915 [Bradyrhizobiaceae bacterium]|nr:hypothetical protein [Bradyrhizobiaceae bacterium]MBO0754591.1 hypothetical protein [Bradyrhizobiaceae bacterium]